MIALEKCPVCKNGVSTNFLYCKDYTVSKEKFTIVECSECKFRYTNPIPDENEIGAYYQSEDYISHSGTKKGIVNRLYHMVRNYTIKQKYKLINKHDCGDKNILDIGCGTGEFLAYCKSKGWNTLGLEPDPKARVIVEQNGVEVKEPKELFNNLRAKKYDVVTMWHVLEHVHRLDDTIKAIKRVLKPGGTLIVAVPNCGSHDAEVYGNQWAAYDVPRHLYHFRPDDIKHLFGNIDMEVKEVLPMKFDAYYVGMLSENLKAQDEGKEKGSVLKGFKTGFKSNSKALEGTYSSQIYVIQNK